MAGSTPARRRSHRPVSDGHQSNRPGSRDISTAGTPASVPAGSTASSAGVGMPTDPATPSARASRAAMSGSSALSSGRT
jgi:hypothetical protein